MAEISNGKFENAKAVWEQTSRLEQQFFGLQKDILTQGFENRIGSLEQTNLLQREIGGVKLDVERTAFATQLRDLGCDQAAYTVDEFISEFRIEELLENNLISKTIADKFMSDEEKRE